MEEMKERLRRMRVARHLSQRELAVRAQVSQAWVSQHERGFRNDVSLNCAIIVAAILGCSVEWLLFGSGDLPDALVGKPMGRRKRALPGTGLPPYPTRKAG